MFSVATRNAGATSGYPTDDLRRQTARCTGDPLALWRRMGRTRDHAPCPIPIKVLALPSQASSEHADGLVAILNPGSEADAPKEKF
jgi:hypothetical protein